MVKKSLFLIIFMVYAFIAPSCIAANSKQEIVDKTLVEQEIKYDQVAQLDKVRNAAYSIVNVAFYGDHKDADFGIVEIKAGRGVILNHDNKFFLLSADHVISNPDLKKSPRPYLLAEKFFIVSNWEEAQKQRYSLYMYFKIFDNDNFLPNNMKDDCLTVSKKVFDNYFNKPEFKKSVVVFDLTNSKHDKTIDAGYVVLDNELGSKLNSLSINDFDFDFDWKIGRPIGVWGTPYTFGEWYREGVVASEYFTGRQFTMNKNFGVVSTACAPGDSGGIVISLESGKIVGIISAIATLRDPNWGIYFPNGIIIKISPFFEKLQLLKE